MSIDWTKIYKKYAGNWIALEDDEITVVASGKDLKTTLELSAKKGNSNPIVFRVPDEILDFVGHENSISSNR